MEIRNQQAMSTGNKFHISTETLLIFAIIFAVVAPLFSHGQLSVLVTDSDQLPLSGVTVTLRGPALMEERIGVTGAQGEYNFTGLPFGSYQVTFELMGFKTLIRENVNVSSTPTTLKISLELAPLEEAITVIAPSPVVDISSSEISILNETSLSLHHSIDQTWDQLIKAPNIDTQRQILTNASRYWLDNIAETQRELITSTQELEKRNIIKVIFGGIFQRLIVPLRRAQSSAPPEFERQTEIFLSESYRVADAMARIAASGRSAFDLTVKSYPPGAKIWYWRIYFKPREHYEPTPAIIRNLDYAVWHLKLEKDDYYTEEITYDPLRDECHTVVVKLRRKEPFCLSKAKQ